MLNSSRNRDRTPPQRSWFGRVAVRVAIVLIRWYQVMISPLIGPSCRFTPTCSAYAVEAIEKYGFIRGAWRSLQRIGRCHPWSSGGYDPP
ncbi:MAG: membrane protein insertion efficiency factor YidD [Planctomycetota bacterium]